MITGDDTATENVEAKTGFDSVLVAFLSGSIALGLISLWLFSRPTTTTQRRQRMDHEGAAAGCFSCCPAWFYADWPYSNAADLSNTTMTTDDTTADNDDSIDHTDIVDIDDESIMTLRTDLVMSSTTAQSSSDDDDDNAAAAPAAHSSPLRRRQLLHSQWGKRCEAADQASHYDSVRSPSL